jgi:hypothetical protein
MGIACIIWVIKLRGMMWERHVTCMRKMWDRQHILVEKLEGRDHLGDHGVVWSTILN